MLVTVKKYNQGNQEELGDIEKGSRDKKFHSFNATNAHSQFHIEL